MNTRGSEVARFQVKHATLFFCIFIFIITAFSMLIIDQNNEYRHEDQKSLVKYFKEFNNRLDNRFYQIESRLNQIRISAEADVFNMRQTGLKKPFSYKYIKQEPGKNYYHTDQTDKTYEKYIQVSLGGIGKFQNRGKEFDRVVQTGLNLADDFQAFKQAVPSLIYIYYFTVFKQVFHHPWVTSKRYKFEDSVFDYDIWKMAVPKNNPEGNIFWTDAYFDNGDDGVMTSCGVPLYDSGKFTGVVGADLTVDFLNSIVTEFEPQRNGRLLVFDRKQQLLACPDIVSCKDERLKNLKEGLPAELASKLNTILGTKNYEIIKLGDWRFIISKFRYSPFTILYYYPKRSILASIIEKMGYWPLGFLISLLILVSASLYVTHSRLVYPTEKFVNFILGKSHGKKVVIDKKVPPRWLPWFSTVERIFDEKQNLTESLKNKNIELEKNNVKLQKQIDANIKAHKEKKSLQQQLIQEEKVKAIGLLAGGVAHDFNNQLGVIMGYTSILLNKNLSEDKQRECLEYILASAQCSSDLTTQLLAFARKGDFLNVPVNLHNQIDDVLTIFSRTTDKRILLKTIQKAKLFTINGDPSQIKNVIMNIAINAKNAMPDGGRITVSTENVILSHYECQKSLFNLEPGEFIKIVISDTGVGIDEETKKHIFEPFFTTRNSGKGSGLGLAAAIGTIKNHKGSIEVDSTYGSGTEFTIMLPILHENINVKKKEIIDASIYAADSNYKVMIIDDEYRFCRMLTDFMSSLGYNVKPFYDPFPAVEFYRKSWKDIDIVVMDMIMPKLNGYDLFNELKAINPDIKLLISSGYSQEARTREMCNDGRIKGFFHKPFSLTAFAKAVYKQLSKNDPENKN